MKSPRLSSPVRDRSRGVALVLVLAILVLLLGLVITFLSRARVERGATSAFAAASGTTRLADLATSLVKAQIRDATTQGNSVAWTSQPGMIRTFGSGSPGSFTAGSNLLRVFKLYSTRELIATGYTAGADAPPSGWQNSGALWTDLNAPVLVANPDGGSPAKVPRFPILDPSALNAVEGFEVTSAAAPSGSVLTGGNDALRLPMPVRWLYALQDGRLVAPTENTGHTASVPGATPSNPVVGRVAFWTDDESCKINVNTASEGTAWDTPRADSTEERDFANYQPAQNEFQRYPGNPAATSLAPVLFATSSTFTPALTAAQRDAIYSIAPRVVGGGSDAGTRVAAAPLQPGTDRLYASIDELIFAADRLAQPANAVTRDKLEAARFFLTASSQAPETTLFNTPRVAMWPIFKDLEPSRVTAYDRLIAFCATINNEPYYFQRANARSPIADWANIRRNRQLLRYLRALSDKPVPGFGAALVSKTSIQDRDQLLVAMMDYIRSTNLYDDNLTPTTYANDSAAQNAVQFTGGRLSSSVLNVGSGHGAVAPLRVPSGLPDSASYPAEPDSDSLMGFGRFHTISEAAILFICSGDGSAGTTDDPITTAPPDPNAAAKRLSNDPATNNTLGGAKLAPNERRIQAMLFFDFFSVMQGWTQYSLDSSFDIELIGGNFTINGTSLGFPATVTANQDNQVLENYNPWGGYMGIRKALTADNWSRYRMISVPITVQVSADADPTMVLRGPAAVRVKIFSKPSSSRGAGDTDLVQTIDLHFPEAAIPIPALRTKGTVAVGTTVATPMQTWWTFSRDGIGDGSNGRLQWVKGQPSSDFAEYAGNFIWPEDTLRSLVPYHGDLRLVAGSHYVPLGVFQPSDGYFDTRRVTDSWKQVASNPLPQIKNYLTGSARSHYEGGAGFTLPPAANRLVAGAAYSAGANPKTPAFVTAAGGAPVSANTFQLYGDFDNGGGVASDGPYLNKPDEGNNARTSGALPYFGRTWEQAASGPTFFSPNRQIPGPGMFGSLPTRGFSGNQAYSSAPPQSAWRTLLVRPQSDHPGADILPDHLWLDLFWMPVVEPYAISSPFATAGKINMNYQIEPFTYIRRATGLAALFRSETIAAFPTSAAADYKIGGAAPAFASFRLPINTVETLKQFDSRFAQGSVFRSPTEICGIHLIPSGQSLNADGSNADSVMQTFWRNHALTGDNTRERPYTNLQARLTTRSNTYTVHYCVQTLKKKPGGNAAVWDETKDTVTGELRGSETIERYISPNEEGIPDYAGEYSADASAEPADLGAFYKWRTVQTRRFAP
jgi:uncharacterized protein (TIGR02600 family)